MQSTVTDLIGRTGELNMPILYFYLDITIDSLLQFTLWPFYDQEIVGSDCYGNPLGQYYRLFTYTRHNTFVCSYYCYVYLLPAGQPL